jgi:hypothetical protein
MTIAGGTDLCLSAQTGAAGCGAGDHEESNPSSCESVCTVTTFAILSAGPVVAATGRANPQAPAHSATAGIAFAPNPFPPRS